MIILSHVGTGESMEMKIGVNISSGRAVRYRADLTPAELKKLGYRPATEEEEKRYWELKPAFERHEIKEIRLAPEKK